MIAFNFICVSLLCFSAAIVRQFSVSGKGAKQWWVILNHRAYLLPFGIVRFLEIDLVNQDSFK
ncbi:MAG: hypothetical protein U0N01_04720 [Pseudoruminococcus massiliensis]|uniref:hypothetical protein n=1 Tax=Pseudoruminococcus massiliensis TaxID=2086583 RepID=UPI002F94FA2C